MSRRKQAKPREIAPDFKYNNVIVAKTTNAFMLDGKKNIARHLVYSALDLIGSKTKQDALAVLSKFYDNVTPKLEVRSKRVGGATYQVPIELSAHRALSLSIRWLRRAVRENSGRLKAHEALANEVIEGSEGKGFCIRKKEEIHKMAEANKVFSHYRW